MGKKTLNTFHLRLPYSIYHFIYTYLEELQKGTEISLSLWFTPPVAAMARTGSAQNQEQGILEFYPGLLGGW